MPTHTPLDEKGDIMSFDDLAKRSEGQKMIGFLKLDLDRVGELVKRHSEKVSGLATVSQLLSFIMEGAVNVVAESYPNVYLSILAVMICWLWGLGAMWWNLWRSLA
jgi:CRISPR/Cas system-associated protein Cas10 (large subunit of type III CRISPR-Cas system)